MEIYNSKGVIFIISKILFLFKFEIDYTIKI
jgi:hypothetical protein